jgi:hypothetical protein
MPCKLTEEELRRESGLGSAICNTVMPQSKPKGHHFLPRFFIENFASRRTGKESYCYFFRRSAEFKSKEVNIRDVAKARYFHGDPSSSELEARMAKIESKLAQVVQDVLARGRPLPEESLRLAQLITSCLVRTRNFRNGVSVSMSQMLNLLPTYMSNLSEKELRTGTLEALGRLADKRPDIAHALSLMTDAQREALVSTFLAGLGLPAIRRLALEQVRSFVSAVDVEAISADSHIKALLKHSGFLENDPESRVAIAEKLNWSLRESAGVPYILGDVAVLGLRAGGTVLENPMRFGWPPGALCLPLSPRFLLVGTSSGSDFQCDPESINLASAEVSRDFFISSTCSPREAHYATRLNVRAELIDASELEGLLGESRQ